MSEKFNFQEQPSNKEIPQIFDEIRNQYGSVEVQIGGRHEAPDWLDPFSHEQFRDAGLPDDTDETDPFIPEAEMIDIDFNRPEDNEKVELFIFRTLDRAEWILQYPIGEPIKDLDYFGEYRQVILSNENCVVMDFEDDCFEVDSKKPQKREVSESELAPLFKAIKETHSPTAEPFDILKVF